jgi:protein TonB
MNRVSPITTVSGEAASGTDSATSNTAPISVGALDSKAISLPQPIYPPIAKVTNLSGTVVVQITVDETGKVISASVVSGHPLLRAAAIKAAYQARFAPQQVNGKTVRVSGTVSYNFSPE